MQEYQNEKLVRTEIANSEGFSLIREDSTHQVIGKLPKKNQVITVNGLQYVVMTSDFVRGTFVAKLNGLKEESKEQ